MRPRWVFPGQEFIECLDQKTVSGLEPVSVVPYTSHWLKTRFSLHHRRGYATGHRSCAMAVCTYKLTLGELRLQSFFTRSREHHGEVTYLLCAWKMVKLETLQATQVIERAVRTLATELDDGGELTLEMPSLLVVVLVPIPLYTVPEWHQFSKPLVRTETLRCHLSFSDRPCAQA